MVSSTLSIVCILFVCIARTEAFGFSVASKRGLNNRLLSKCDMSKGEGQEIHPSTEQSRKKFMQIALSFSLSAALSTQRPAPVSAAYGDNSNMQLPSYIDFLIEKNSSADQSKVLYKGADSEIQIKRISVAAARLNDIPLMAKEKKWSQVQGILTGPLGTLLQTMNSLCKETDSGEAKKAAAKVKGDIILISQEASKKNEGGVVKACADAQKDLEAFAKLVF